jgi:hypothetical protein
VVERGLGSSLPPTELARRDSGVFVEMKCLFSIALKDGKGGEVGGVFLAEEHSPNAGGGSVGHWASVRCVLCCASAISRGSSDV